MLGDEERLSARDEGPKPPEMIVREPLGTAERQADTMQA
jgi:hypothetical protein